MESAKYVRTDMYITKDSDVTTDNVFSMLVAKAARQPASHAASSGFLASPNPLFHHRTKPLLVLWFHGGRTEAERQHAS